MAPPFLLLLLYCTCSVYCYYIARVVYIVIILHVYIVIVFLTVCLSFVILCRKQNKNLN